MNIENKISELESIIKKSMVLINGLKKEYKMCKDFTAIFLNVCKKYKIKKVSIGTKTEKIPETLTFPFGVQDNIFTDNVSDKNDRPSIWRVAEDLEPDLHFCVGNGNQVQVSKGYSSLIEGYYELKAGKFKKRS